MSESLSMARVMRRAGEVRAGSGQSVRFGMAMLLAFGLSCLGQALAAGASPAPCIAAADLGRPAAQSVASAAASLAAREAWSVRLRRNDHGGREALHAVYAAAHGPLWLANGRPTPQALELLAILQDAGAYGLDPDDYDPASFSALARAIAAGSLAPDISSPSTGGRPRIIKRRERVTGTGRCPAAAGGGAAGTASCLNHAFCPRRAGPGRNPDPALHTRPVAGRRSQPLCLADEEARLDLGLSAAAVAFVSDLHYGRIDPRAAGFELGAPRPDDLDLGNALRTLATTDDVARAIATFEPQFEHYRLLEQALARYRQLAAAHPLDPRLAARVRKIDLTLERWRWLPAFQTPPIIVNIPEFRLFAFRQTADRAADILQMDVIVGRTFPRTRTPVFAADMKSVLFRPYWDVPRSIMLEEMLPKIRAHPAYLASQHLEIVSDGSGAAVLPVTAESIAALVAGTARLRQQPGPDNALGLIKFDLPNFHEIYLHSTPAQQLFLRSRRAFSHGCIRVSDPVALAAYVLRDTPGGWTPAKIEAAMHGTETRRVMLAKPIRVMILYGTVLAKEDGETLFFKDIYRQDRRLERLLGLAPIKRVIPIVTAK